jgi:GMP synthase (glutamine-hydrolysing)
MDKVIILDFGSQYTQLIARRVRELNIYSEIYAYDHCPNIDDEVKAVILSGSKNSVNSDSPYIIDVDALAAKVPVLGICYGSQLIAHLKGGKVTPSKVREYGRAHIHTKPSTLFDGLPPQQEVWMSHSDTITDCPENFNVIASTDDIPVAAYQVKDTNIYGLQFHPEVSHTQHGTDILRNFLYQICQIAPDWTPAHFVDQSIAQLQQTIGNEKVLLALSGGVDSSVAAALLHKAIGSNLICVFVDNGLLRKNEYEQVLQSYQSMGLNIKGVDAKALFYARLKGLTDPEAKRKAIGKAFIDVFEEAASQEKDIRFLAQGTIYPDVVESFGKHSSTIKSHHNVGGLPEKMKLKVVEPLRLLFKDEVRRVGASVQVPERILQRHPFPGPGLGIRILGEVTAEKVRLLQEADDIFIQSLHQYELYHTTWQAGAILLPVQTVGVMGDERTYENCVALRAVVSVDGMTADWAHLPYEFLAKVSNDIINRVKGINRVVYDISSKPPATIEWE